MTARALAGVVAVLVTAFGCTSNPALPAGAGPAYPAFMTPEAPASVVVPPDVRDRHGRAWRRLQGGDPRGAAGEFAAILTRWPDFYPSGTGLAYARLAERQLQPAADRFRAVLARAPGYLPAWHGLVDAELGLAHEAEAIAALERIVAIEPANDAAQTRLELLRFKAVAVEYARAAASDPKPAQPGTQPHEPAEDVALPKEFRSLATAASVTRGELAALIGMRLERLVLRAPRQMAVVATDVRGHWAERWILAVTAAGVMEVLPNHTFQPSQPVRRDQLASVVSALLEVAAADKPREMALWTTARPLFTDLPSGHLFYQPAALAVAAGAMAASDDGRFQPAGPASGADVVRAVGRIDRLAAR